MARRRDGTIVSAFEVITDSVLILDHFGFLALAGSSTSDRELSGAKRPV